MKKVLLMMLVVCFMFVPMYGCNDDDTKTVRIPCDKEHPGPGEIILPIAYKDYIDPDTCPVPSEPCPDIQITLDQLIDERPDISSEQSLFYSDGTDEFGFYKLYQLRFFESAEMFEVGGFVMDAMDASDCPDIKVTDKSAEELYHTTTINGGAENQIDISVAKYWDGRNLLHCVIDSKGFKIRFVQVCIVWSEPDPNGNTRFQLYPKNCPPNVNKYRIDGRWKLGPSYDPENPMWSKVKSIQLGIFPIHGTTLDDMIYVELPWEWKYPNP